MIKVFCFFSSEKKILFSLLPLVLNWNYSLVPDSVPHTHWAFVWAHGRDGDRDQRGLPLPAFAADFRTAGYDVYRFDRVPFSDDTDRAAGWLAHCLVVLRARGYARIVVAGQSRGGWNALQMIDRAGLADAVVAISPAAQGTARSLDFLGQDDALREIVDRAPASSVRVAVAQFADDWFAADEDRRARLLGRLRGRVALLMIDRPAGLVGHSAGNGADFGKEFGPCLVRFAGGGTCGR